MSEITSQEAQQVLQVLVAQRRALEKGLEIISLLATAEQATQERQAALVELDAKIESKQQDVVSLDEHLAEKKAEIEVFCKTRKDEVDAYVKSSNDRLEKIRTECGDLLQAKRDGIAQLQLEHEDLMATYHAQEAELSSQIAQMREVLDDLKKRVAVVAGV